MQTHLVETIIRELQGLLANEPAWQSASPSQLEHAAQSIQRAIIAEIYTNALFPNDDADVCRDQ